MQFSDPRKMDILLSLDDIYDFSGYVAECERQQLRINGSEMEFAQKVGMVEYAKRKWPEKSAFESYMLLVSGASNIRINDDKPCCGGGEVR